LKEKKSEDSEFLQGVVQKGKDLFKCQEGVIHNSVEITGNRKEGCRLESYSLFKTRKAAENSVDLEKKLIQESGLKNDLVLEATQIIHV